ncbi:MAG TPA: hypothetical protein VI997_03065 [Candidatus Thermoplasmatota archaeon]|nr:hypothetical protein [Candidatus Thermoplasmatota archaeon]
MPATKSERMDKMTFTVPARVKKRAQARGDVNWSAVVAKHIEEKLASLELVDRITAKSKLTQADVDELADIVDTAMAKHFGLIK